MELKFVNHFKPTQIRTVFFRKLQGELMKYFTREDKCNRDIEIFGVLVWMILTVGSNYDYADVIGHFIKNVNNDRKD